MDKFPPALNFEGPQAIEVKSTVYFKVCSEESQRFYIFSNNTLVDGCEGCQFVFKMSSDFIIYAKNFSLSHIGKAVFNKADLNFENTLKNNVKEAVQLAQFLAFLKHP